MGGPQRILDTIVVETIVRPRRAADLDTAARVLVEVHAHDGYPVEGVADPLAWLQPRSLICAWVAELKGEVVGHVALSAPTAGDHAVQLLRELTSRDDRELAVLGRLFVRPAARRRSIGEALVRTTMDDAARRGLELVLDVMSKDAAAIRLDERLGWQRIGTATHTVGHGRQIEALCYRVPSRAGVVG